MIDVIIPCYNAENTLLRSVQSALNQAELGKIWLIDDSSTDRTFELMLSLKKQFPKKICIDKCRKMAVSQKQEIGGHCKVKRKLSPF